MIVIKVELHSAINGTIVSLGQMVIDNIGGSRTRGNYRCRTWRKGAPLNPKKGVTREATVTDHPRLAKSVWNLVFKALKELRHD